MKTLEVGKDKAYKTISSAIKAANDGDEIVIEPALYEECFEINKELYLHSSLDLTKAKNNFSSDDIPIICIKAFETLRITEKCKIKNLLFTQKKKLSFNSFSEAVASKKQDSDISSDEIIRDSNNKEFEVMIEIFKDVECRESFFVFSTYHGVAIFDGISSFAKTFFSNNYADNILVFNDASLMISDKCRVENAINGNGVYAYNNAKLNIQKSRFSDNKCVSIFAIDSASVFVDSCELLQSNIGFFSKSKNECRLTGCNIRKNDNAGVICRGGNIYINNCDIEENEYGIGLAGRSFSEISNCTIFENTYSGIAAVENSSSDVKDCMIKENAKCGMLLKDNSSMKVIKSQFLNMDDENPTCVHAEENVLLNIKESKFEVKKGHGIRLKDNSKVVLCESVFNGQSESFGIEMLNTTNAVCYKCMFNNFKSGVMVTDSSVAKLVECDIKNGTIVLMETSKVYGYKSCVSGNLQGAAITTSGSNAEGFFIECEMSQNSFVFCRGDYAFANSNGKASFINCKFTNNMVDFIYSGATAKKVTKAEEEKLYNKYFADEIKLIKENIGIETENKINNTNEFVDNDLFDKDSIKIIASCLSKIKKEFGIEIFSKKNLRKFINICKDFCPNKDTEIDFIKQLCEAGLLEELAKNKLKKNFYERFYNVSDSFITRKKIASFISKFEKLFGVDIVDNK